MHLHFFSFEYFMLIFWYLSPSPDSSHPDSSLPFSFPQYFIVSVSPLPSPTSLSYECSLCWPITVVCVACLWVRGQPWIYQLSFPSKKQAFSLPVAVKGQSQLGVDFLPTTSPPWWDFVCFDRVQFLCMHSQFVSSFVLLSSCIWNRLFSWSYSSTLVLTNFLAPIPLRSMSREGGLWYRIPI